MKLYHGTAYKNLASILKNGIKPRGKNKGVWDNCPSRNNRVYMTNCYAPYFAFSAGKNKCVIFEIDTDKLDTHKMGADEDVVAQAICTQGNKQDLIEFTKTLDLEKFDCVWDKSLEAMGTCSYKGKIPVEAITRYVVIDFKKATWLWVRCADISITLINHQIMGNEHRNLTGWMFGDNDLESMWDKLNPKLAEQTKKNNLDKSALKVYSVNHGG